MGVTTEVVRNVYDDDKGMYISVGPDDVSLGGFVRIETRGKSCEEFGPCRLVPALPRAKVEVMKRRSK